MESLTLTFAEMKLACNLMLFNLFLILVSTEYMDFRFFKDLELKENFFFCCCCKRYALEMYVEDKDAKGSERDPSANAFTAPHILLHPEAAKVEQIVRNAWTQARLVAD